MKTVLTFGVFDMMHIGHVILFEKAQKLGDRLIVAVQDDETVLKYKPEAKLIYNTQERIYMVSSVRYVDEAIVYSDVDSDIQKVDFDIFAIGEDQLHKGFQNAVEWCENHGKVVIRIPRTENISSTILRDYKKL